MLREIVLKNSVIDETLFNLMMSYGPSIDKDDTAKELKEKAQETIRLFNEQKSEIICPTKSYPPFALYVVLDYIDRTKNPVSFYKSTESEKENLVKETSGFLTGLKNEIRKTTNEEKDRLKKEGKSLIYQEKK